jgi:hypothetical protein
MKWSRTYSKRAGTLHTILGVAIILGAFVDPVFQHSFDMVVPGLVMGGAWTAVGIKRGFPIVATSRQHGLSDGLAIIRSRCWRLVAFTVAWVSAAAMTLPRLPKNAVGTAFFLSTLPLAWAFLTWTLSGCPRCGQHFYAVGRFQRRYPPMSQCQSCGLKMRTALHDGSR